MKKSKSENNEISAFLNFLDRSPTAWHAVANCATTLSTQGFNELKEQDSWHVKPGNRYFVTRNGSSICAFVVPIETPEAARIIASHTDSPALKLKPNAEFYKENMVMLGLEVYGSPILSSWLNRDLGIAGRIVFINKKEHVEEQLVRFEEFPLVIPQLAIHLDREVNEKGVVLNKQDHLAALAGLKMPNKTTFLERNIKKSVEMKELLGCDLFVYPLEKARLIGEDEQLISSYRIDSLESVFAALQALSGEKEPDESILKMVVLWDNEEVGSNTAQGAGSPFLSNILERIVIGLGGSREKFLRLLSRSCCASVDLAHALHPNYPEKHEPRHLAFLNKGVVIKTNAQQRYASDARSAAQAIEICRKHKIPYQLYSSRGDIPCGSTVGPISASSTGIATVDIGCAQLSMHSCREVMGVQDHLSMVRLLKHYLNYC